MLEVASDMLGDAEKRHEAFVILDVYCLAIEIQIPNPKMPQDKVEAEQAHRLSSLNLTHGIYAS